MSRHDMREKGSFSLQTNNFFMQLKTIPLFFSYSDQNQSFPPEMQIDTPQYNPCQVETKTQHHPQTDRIWQKKKEIRDGWWYQLKYIKWLYFSWWVS